MERAAFLEGQTVSVQPVETKEKLEQNQTGVPLSPLARLELRCMYLSDFRLAYLGKTLEGFAIEQEEPVAPGAVSVEAVKGAAPVVSLAETNSEQKVAFSFFLRKQLFLL